MMKPYNLYPKMVQSLRNFHNSQMIEIMALKKDQMTKIKMKVIKILSIHKHLFLYYPPDLVKTEQLMKFSIERNMNITIQVLIGHIMKFYQLMSSILLNT